VLHRVVIGGLGVGHAQRDLVDAVAVQGVVGGDLVASLKGAGEHEPDATLLEHVRHAVAPTRLEAGVSGLREAEGVHEVEGRLGGVPHVHLDVIDAVDGHTIVVCRKRNRARNQLFCRHHVMIPRSTAAFNADLLRPWHTSGAYGRH
jgi:hypothetical protein